MRTVRIVTSALLLAVFPACATTTTTEMTWADPSPPGNTPRWGRVDSVQEVVQRSEGNPAGGALAGAAIGALLFGSDAASAFFGAAGGAVVGAAASQSSSETRTYRVTVRFDDGGYATFMYSGYSPFGPGARVVLTPQGLVQDYAPGG